MSVYPETNRAPEPNTFRQQIAQEIPRENPREKPRLARAAPTLIGLRRSEAQKRQTFDFMRRASEATQGALPSVDLRRLGLAAIALAAGAAGVASLVQNRASSETAAQIIALRQEASVAPAVESGGVVQPAPASSQAPDAAASSEHRPDLPAQTGESAELTPPARLGDGVVANGALFTNHEIAPLAPPRSGEALSVTSDARAQAIAVAPEASTQPASQTDAPAPAHQVLHRQAKCLVKVSGRVLFDRACSIQRPQAQGMTLDFNGRSVVVSFSHGETWTAMMDGRSLGNVYKSGSCWGRRKEVYICADGA